jgi:hypothetical protein
MVGIMQITKIKAAISVGTFGRISFIALIRNAIAYGHKTAISTTCEKNPPYL